MPSLRYLNTILTLIAVLLTVNLWTLWATTPGGQMFDLATDAHAAGIANAGAQHKQIVDELKAVNVSIDSLHAMFQDGSARVMLEAAPDQ
jgi:hypothetical protein